MGTEPQSTDSSLADCRAPWCFDSPTTASLMAPQEDVVSRRLARWWPPPRRGDEPTAASAPRQRRGGVWHGVSQAWSGAQRTWRSYYFLYFSYTGRKHRNATGAYTEILPPADRILVQTRHTDAIKARAACATVAVRAPSLPRAFLSSLYPRSFPNFSPPSMTGFPSQPCFPPQTACNTSPSYVRHPLLPPQTKSSYWPR